VFLDKKAHGCDIVQWILSLIERSVKSDIHIFSLDFSSALLANILHAQSTITTLAPLTVTGILNRILGMLQVPHPQLPTSVLMHLLICLSYLKRDRFQQSLEQCQFIDRIADFVETYSARPAVRAADGSSENGEIDKRTVLDLCAHMFHPKEHGGAHGGANSEEPVQYSSASNAGLEYNDMRAEDKIREFENEQGDLIFECF